MFTHSFAAVALMGSVALMACSSSTPSKGDSQIGESVGGKGSGGKGSATGSTDQGSSSSVLDRSGGNSGVDIGKGGGGPTDAGSGSVDPSAGGNSGSDAGASSRAGSGSDGLGGSTTVIPELGGTGTIDPEGFGGAIVGDTDDPPEADTDDPPEADTDDPPEADTGDPPEADTGDPPEADTGDPPEADTGDPPEADTGDPPDECVPSEIDNINVIVFKDASPSGADSEGRMYVGGNLTANGYGIASKDNETCTSDQYSLVVGGDITLSGGSIGDGKVAYGGDASLDNFTAACGSWKFPDSIDPPVDFVELEATLKGYSIAFTQYPVNGTVTGSLVLTGTDPKLNVFSITGDQLGSASQIRLVAPDESSIIVNVSGTDIMWSGAGFILPDGQASCRGASTEADPQLLSGWCHKILWNMYEATTLTLSGIGVQGSILAPYATLDGGGGNVDGQVIVEYLFGGIEYHPYFFSGCLELPMDLSSAGH
jgi:choice-of-anchor A domain-containing protein